MQRRDVEAPVRHLFLMCIVVLMAVGHVLLGLLAQRDQHGYELKQLHDETFPAVRPLAFGQIYTALERLAAKGFVELLETVRIDGPDRKVFRLTPAGRSELDRWLMEIDRPADFVVNPFAVKATLLLLLSGRDGAADYLRRQRAACIERMRQLTRRRSDPTVSTAEVLAADYEVAHLAADIEWMETASARVADLVAPPPVAALRTTSATPSTGTPSTGTPSTATPSTVTPSTVTSSAGATSFTTKPVAGRPAAMGPDAPTTTMTTARTTTVSTPATPTATPETTAAPTGPVPEETP